MISSDDEITAENIALWDAQLSIAYGENATRHETVLRRLRFDYWAEKLSRAYPPISWSEATEELYDEFFATPDFWSKAANDGLNCKFAMERYNKYRETARQRPVEAYPFVIPHGTSVGWKRD